MQLTWCFVASSLLGRPRRRVDVRNVEDNDQAWRAFEEFNLKERWRGWARSVTVDPVLRKASLDVLVDGQRYMTRFEAEDHPSFREVCEWASGDVESRGRDFSVDLDGSYSIDYNMHSLGGATARFATEAAFAVADAERVRVVASYDLSGSLRRVTVLDEVKVGRDADGCYEGAQRSEADLFDLHGDWQGDATVRRRAGLAVSKQDVSFRTDGERFVRMLTVADSADILVELESFGRVKAATPEGVELVAMDDGYALVLLVEAGAYCLAPLAIGEKEPFFVEAGLIVDERSADRDSQLPISIRVGEEFGAPTSTSTRYLARSVRLYADDGALASVTTSYHRRR